MQLKTHTEGSNLTIYPQGKLDTITAPEFLEAASAASRGMTSVTLDLTSLTYISSAGLRAILALKKQLGSGCGLQMQNPCDIVREVFEVSCFTELLED